MTKNSGYGQGLEIAALNKTGAGSPVDLMRPGNGTPWEDRGSTGAIGAYFKTMIKSLTSPGLLLDHIRRPETTSDSVSFATISGAMWVASIFIFNAYWLYFVLPAGHTPYENGARDVDTMHYWMTTLLYAALAAAGLFALLKIGPRMYRSLGAMELKGANPALIQNCFNYCMGPSILALVPLYGSGLAAVWIMINLIVAGKRRLFLKSNSAIINVLLIFAAAVLVAVPTYFLLQWLWGPSMLDMNGLTLKPPVKVIVIPTRD